MVVSGGVGSKGSLWYRCPRLGPSEKFIDAVGFMDAALSFEADMRLAVHQNQQNQQRAIGQNRRRFDDLEFLDSQSVLQ